MLVGRRLIALGSRPAQLARNNITRATPLCIRRYASEAMEERNAPTPAPEGDFTQFNLSAHALSILEKRGIQTLFPIQTATYQHIYDGKDMMAKAQTGTGKTLAFALPMLERLVKTGVTKLPSGRRPRQLVLCPTRELAKQVTEQFLSFAPKSINVLCCYGGAGYDVNLLRNGVDIVVGTPGRVMDLAQKGALRLSDIQTLCLDEADHMLDIGFAQDMEKVIDMIRTQQEIQPNDPSKHQTLLFSATMPEWVHRVSRTYLRPDKVVVDLVGNENSQANKMIRYVAMACNESERPTVLADVLRLHGGGRSVVFAETKRQVEELGEVLRKFDTAAGTLHGDMTQGLREATLAAFRNGELPCVVATDVAARGLDVPNVDLVVQYEPPSKTESFLHRSGRTGRAGKSGLCIMLYSVKNDSGRLRMYERDAKVAFERLPVPGANEVARFAADHVIKAAQSVQPETMRFFMDNAKKLTETLTPELAVASVLAVATNRLTLGDRSALTGKLGMTTLSVRHGKTDSDARTVVLQVAGTNRLEYTMLKDHSGFLLDVPQAQVEHVKAELVKHKCELVPLDTLPPLVAMDRDDRRGDDNRRGGYQRGGYQRGGERRSFNRSDQSSGQEEGRGGFQRGGFQRGGERRSFNRSDQSSGQAEGRRGGSFERRGDKPSHPYNKRGRWSNQNEDGGKKFDQKQDRSGSRSSRFQ